MIEGVHPVLQALLAGLFTWAVTAAGAAVALLPIRCNWLLDGSLGFAAGVMSAASFWSLLDPAIEAGQAQIGNISMIPIAGSFLLGSAFVYASDYLLPFLGFSSSDTVTAYIATGTRLDVHSPRPDDRRRAISAAPVLDHGHVAESEAAGGADTVDAKVRRAVTVAAAQYQVATVEQPEPTPFTAVAVSNGKAAEGESEHEAGVRRRASESYRRIMLLIIAVVVHNIPEGFAIGAAFGAIGGSSKATYKSAVALALGIGIQNFPEGMAVAMPLAGFGYKKWKCFVLGQSSGLVEPISAMVGAALVSIIEPVVPYSLAFAAGAMLTAVFDDIVPEAQAHGQARIASVGAIAGFTVMMALEVTTHF